MKSVDRFHASLKKLDISAQSSLTRWRDPEGLILGYLPAEKSVDQITAVYPDLKCEQIAVCLDYARELADFEAAV